MCGVTLDIAAVCRARPLDAARYELVRLSVTSGSRRPGGARASLRPGVDVTVGSPSTLDVVKLDAVTLLGPQRGAAADWARARRSERVKRPLLPMLQTSTPIVSQHTLVNAPACSSTVLRHSMVAKEPPASSLAFILPGQASF